MTYQPPQPNPPAQPTVSAPDPSQRRRTNLLAIIGLVGAFILPVAGVVCAHIGLGQIKRTGEGGRGLAIAALVIGYLAIAVALLFAGFFLVLASVYGAADSSTYPY